MDQKGFMRAAIERAREGICDGQTPFGACVVKGGRIISCEHNSVWADKDPIAHAEVNAIREACRKLGTIDLSGCVIYSTTEPCPMCFSAIHWAGIGRIVYGAPIAQARRAGFRELSISNRQMKSLGKSGIRVEGGFMEEGCESLFSEWKSAGGKPY